MTPLEGQVFGAGYIASPTTDTTQQAQHAAHPETGNATPAGQLVMALGLLFIGIYGLHLYERWRHK